ncbi:MAG TPA: 30S ribosomal protein S6 [Candidatus Saccharimonadales bacterium]|nr:30S ribosomal protein S6 [Candidatus Saccharimonadales bacterium]
MNQYEIAVLFDPDLEIDLEKATSRVEKIFTSNGAKVLKLDNWGKRKLAYPIKKHETAIYIIYLMDIPAEGVRKIEGSLNITDEVIRFLIVRPDLKAIARAEQARLDIEEHKSAAESDNTTKSDSDDQKKD